MTIHISDGIGQLLDERQQHADALQVIDRTLSRIQVLLGVGFSGHKKRGRPAKNSSAHSTPRANGTMTLADHLEAIIKNAGKPLGIGELIAGVKASGYKSKAKDIRPIVSLALIKDKRFKRVDRGIYAVR
jgi:hypothetical protein